VAPPPQHTIVAKMITPPSAQKSQMMSQVRSKGTAPELALRSSLHSAGFRFRLHRKDLPGKPDIVLPKYKRVIFVHGCFWHHHEGCSKSKMPKTNVEFWQNKITANIRRDKTNQDDLAKLGWQVLVVWECDIKKNVCEASKQIESSLKGCNIDTVFTLFCP
jgi:DNA mismatch endonuclease (patch repair protein)